MLVQVKAECESFVISPPKLFILTYPEPERASASNDYQNTATH